MVFGPHPRSYEQRLPKRMKRLALHGALTAKFGDGAIRVVDELDLDAPKTRVLVGYLDALKASRPHPRRRDRQRTPTSSSRRATCPGSSIIRADSLNVVDVLNADTLLITQPSLETMAEVYA